MSLIEPEVLAEIYLTVDGEGRATLAGSKLDPRDEAKVPVIVAAALGALVEWAKMWGYAPAALIGDGGPEVARMRQELYQLREEVAKHG